MACSKGLPNFPSNFCLVAAEAGAVVTRRVAVVGTLLEARELAFSLLSLTWALGFTGQLDSELEERILGSACEYVSTLFEGAQVCNTT